MAENLMDDDGENRAVRCFLMQYGAPGLTVGGMRMHMKMCGFAFWPDWTSDQQGAHLTKAGAQIWLRHLFSLESVSSPLGAAGPLGDEDGKEADRG